MDIGLGDQGESVLRSQEFLKILGFYAGPLDGVFDLNVSQSVRKFKHKTQVTDRVDQETLDAMERAVVSGVHLENRKGRRGHMKTRSLGNTDANGAKKNVGDLVIWGDGDQFKLLFKASSEEEGWFKSTKAMEIPGVGCVVQVSTYQEGDLAASVAESATFVPGVRIEEVKDDEGKVIGRKLVDMKGGHP
jgi:hypothetical protein